MKRKIFTKSLWVTLLSFIMVSLITQRTSAVETTFRLDASSIIASGEFIPGEDFLDIAGDMNGWTGGDDWMLEPIGDSIYQIVIPDIPNGEYNEFKFRINGDWSTAEFPGQGNRGYTFLDNKFIVQFIWNVYGHTLIEGVEFDASQTAFPVGSSIDFENMSAGDITAYQWNFEGGTPSASTEENPAGILYENLGVFDVSLEVTFVGGDSYTLTKTDYIDVYGEFETVTLQLDATSIINSGEFNPDEDYIDIAGTMNDFQGGVDWILIVTDNPNIYEITLPNAELGTVHEFKFRINGDWNSAEFPGGGANRMYTIKANETVLLFEWDVYGFSNLSPKDVLFQLDVSDIIESGEFDPDVDSLDIAGTMNEYQGGEGWILEQLTDSIFEITLTGNVNDYHEFKFRINSDWATSEFPGQGDRSYIIKQNENIVLFVWNVYGYDLIEGILFDASNTQVVLETPVDFTDASVGDATTWQWYFEGADPGSSTVQNPTGVVYSEIGMYNVSLVVDFGRSGSATYTKQEYIEVIAELKDVMFQLDATSIIESGDFVPGADFLDVAGTMNDWGGGDEWILEQTEDTTIYEVLVPDAGIGVTYEFKFRINGDWATAEFPDGGNRSYTVKAGENTVRFVWNVYGYTPIYITDFEASATEIMTGDAVDFTDLSEGEITGWEWYFEGGTPETSTEQNPEGIIYDTEGVYDVQLTVTRASGDSTVIKEDYMSVEAGGAIQQYNLLSGYQFVSSRIQHDDPDMMVVLSDILDDRLDFVRNTDGSMLRKIGPTWVNSIGDWITVEGYLFKMNEAADFTIEGTEIDPQTPIDLETGYQFISYLPDVPMDALVAFDNILNDNLDFVRSSSGDMLRKIGPTWVNNIGDVVPQEGYLVKMNAADELIYPAMAGKSVNNSSLVPQYFKFDGGNAADPVYTIYPEPNQFLEVGDEIAAFDGKKLVGSTVISANKTFANNLPVFASLDDGKGFNAGNPISIKYYDASENEALPLNIEFSNPYGDAHTNEVYPASDGAYSIVEFTKTGTVDNFTLNLYPNPTSETFEITSAETIIEVNIYDQTGRLLKQYRPGQNNVNIDVSLLNEGMYYVEINNYTSIFNKKIIHKVKNRDEGFPVLIPFFYWLNMSYFLQYYCNADEKSGYRMIG